MKNNNRVKSSIYNSFSNVIIILSNTILSFITRTVFIQVLGKECIGLDGLFTNILTLLSLTELGFSTAVSFSLYEPIAKNDNKKITQIITYLKKIYRKVAFSILTVGLLLIPFMNYIVKGYTVGYNIYIIYLLYLIDTVLSYFTSYSITLLEADQKNYKIAFIKFIFNIIVYGGQLLILLTTKNFILYLLILLIFRQLERIIIHSYIKNKYKNINFSSKDNICSKDKLIIKNNIKGILFHKVGDYAVNGTDNILISSIINISTTGIYSNYLSIISIFKNLLSGVILAITSSFGNLNVEEDEKTKNNVFDILNFCCLFISGITTIGIFLCINKFINIWVGGNFVLDNLCVSIICINFYLTCITLPITMVKNSVGLYHIDRFVPIIQAIINLLISIVLGLKIGILGILLGTCISSILTANTIKPYFVYKYVFKTSCIKYFLSILKNIIQIIMTIVISNSLLSLISINSKFLLMICYGVVGVVLYVLIFFISNYYTKEFKYIKNLILKK